MYLESCVYIYHFQYVGSHNFSVTFWAETILTVQLNTQRCSVLRSCGIKHPGFCKPLRWLHRMVGWLVALYGHLLCRTLSPIYLAKLESFHWNFACWFSGVCWIISEICKGSNSALGEYRKRKLSVFKGEKVNSHFQ